MLLPGADGFAKLSRPRKLSVPIFLDTLTALRYRQVEGLLDRASVLQDRGKHRQALKVLREATTLEPQHVESWAMTGASRRALGQHARATKAYRRALVATGGGALAWKSRVEAARAVAEMAHEAKLAAPAMRYTERALALDPTGDKGAVYAFRAKLRAAAGDESRAAQDRQAACSLGHEPACR